MLVGNLTMLIMYLYENLLVWLWSYFVVHKVTVVNRNSLQKPRGLTHSSIVT